MIGELTIIIGVTLLAFGIAFLGNTFEPTGLFVVDDTPLVSLEQNTLSNPNLANPHNLESNQVLRIVTTDSNEVV